MRSREEVKAEVRKKIDNLSKTQRKDRYRLIQPGNARFSKILLTTYEVEYPNLDVEGHKQHLLDNFDETVRLVVASEISQLAWILSQVEKVESIPEIGSKGMGDVCNFTLQDIKDLGLNDPDFVQNNMDDVVQSLYASYGYEDQLPTSRELANKVSERIRATQEGAKKSEILSISKQIELMKHAMGDGSFTIDGLPLELREDVEKRMDEEIQKAKEEEIKERETSNDEQKISGQKLGQETLNEQKDTQAKQTAMEKLAALRTRVKEGDKQQ